MKLYLCVWERLRPAPSSVLVQLRAAGGQPRFFLGWNGLCHNISKVEQVLTYLLSPSASPTALRLQRSQEKSQSHGEAGTEEQGFPASFCSYLPMDWNNSQGNAWFCTLMSPWSILQKSVLIKKYKELFVLSAKEILYYCWHTDNWSHLECIAYFK